MSRSNSPSIEPWLTVTAGEEAIEFYKAAFQAVEIYRFQDPGGGFVVHLSIQGANFWVSNEVGEKPKGQLGGDNVKMILIVDNPETLFENAVRAGASVVFPVGEDHGWKLGHVVDPFGLHWEMGHPLEK